MYFSWRVGHYASIVILVAAAAFIIYKAMAISKNEHFKDKDDIAALIGPAKWHKNTDTIIVTAHFKENLVWLRNSPYPVVVCSKAGADQPALTADPKCTMKYNRGREFGSYLKFIIEYYDNLPGFVVFLHGHETAWHQQLSMYDAIRCAKKKQYGYISLNNNIFPKLEWSKGNKGYDIIETLWEEHFKPYLRVEMPEYFYHDCCAQFIVSRERILHHAKDVYKKWYDLVFTIEDDYVLGLGFEMLWPMIFGEPWDIAIPASEYKKSRFSCSVRDIAGSEEMPTLNKVYIVIMATTRNKKALSSVIKTVPKSFADYIVIHQGAQADKIKTFDDGHIKVTLQRDIKDYGFYVGVGMLIKANIIPMTAWYLLINDTCLLGDGFESKVKSFLKEMSWRVDIYWADRNGRCNIGMQRRGAVTHGANLYLDLKSIDPVHLAQMEWGMHVSSPKLFPVEQRYHNKTSRSVDSTNSASALYFESFDIVKV